jgi:hypothetical protein
MASRLWVPVASGPLGRYAGRYGSWLAARGYSRWTIAHRLWQLELLSRWLEREGLSPDELGMWYLRLSSLRANARQARCRRPARRASGSSRRPGGDRAVRGADPCRTPATEATGFERTDNVAIIASRRRARRSFA